MSAEACLYATVNRICGVGLSPLITNDYSTWLFPHDLGVNLKVAKDPQQNQVF